LQFDFQIVGVASRCYIPQTEEFVDCTASKWNSDEVGLLYGISQRLLEDRDYGEVLATILDATIEGLGAERGFVLLHEDGEFRAVVARNFRTEALRKTESEFSRSIARDVLQNGRALLLGDALESQEYGNFASVQQFSLKSVLCAPLINSNEVFALIYLENRKFANHFTERKRELLDEICSLAAPRIRTALAIEESKRRAAEMQPLLGGSEGILTADAGMAAVLETIRQIAPTDLPILIQGETGTGKELIAHALYRNSARARGAFVVLNCAALPATLIESELFGSVRGAFTGAHHDRMGMVGAAHRGTLFMDEIGELPLELQTRLLRILQSGEFTRLGSVHPETVDVRFIAATNRDLGREVEEGRFRSDLYFRLSSITLKVPPLRTRPHDVHLLAEHFLGVYARRFGRQTPRLSDHAFAVLAAYSFPGNVRELEGEMARLVAISTPGAEIPVSALSDRIRGKQNSGDARKVEQGALVPMSLAEMEKQLIRTVLETTGGNRTHAASILGITREGLRTKIQRLGVIDQAGGKMDA
jgi:transcriptional regulator with GAF, ATPase, and Fis domain